MTDAPTPDLSPAWRIKHRYTGKILHTVQADTLAGANLRRANLRGALLRRANFRGADLTDADLTDAYLRGADLWFADLTGANLTGANLAGADLRDADLRRADLRGADLTSANLAGADLRDARLADYVVTTVVAQLRRSTGHAVTAFSTADGKIIVSAGCWLGTLAEARVYKAGADYASADENSAICDFIETRARQLALMPARAALENEKRGDMIVSNQTYFDGREHLLNVASRHLQWAKQEPARRDFHMSCRKNAQRHLAQLRAATKITILPGSAKWARAVR